MMVIEQLEKSVILRNICILRRNILLKDSSLKVKRTLSKILDADNNRDENSLSRNVQAQED